MFPIHFRRPIFLGAALLLLWPSMRAFAAPETQTLANVGTTSVSRAELNELLEAQYGEQLLPYLLDTKLISEALKAKNLQISDAEIDADLERRKIQDPNLGASLATATPQRAKFLRQNIERDLGVQKLLVSSVAAPTDAQLSDFFNRRRAFYDQSAKIRLGLLLSSSSARAKQMENLLKSGRKSFSQLVAEQKKLPDSVAKQSTLDRGAFEPLSNLPVTVQKQLESVPKGGWTSAQPLNIGAPQPIWIIFRKTDFQPVVPADFAQIRAQVEADFKMAQVAFLESKKNPQNPPFEQVLTGTRDSLSQTAPNPTLRDVLTTILGPARENVLANLRAKGGVSITDATYKSVGERYKPQIVPVVPQTQN